MDDQLLDGFRIALEAALAGLRERFDVVGRSGLPVGALAGLSKSGRVERSGKLADGTAFSFHGIGCLVVAPDGSQVDFDWTPDGTATFDAWRFLNHGRSRGLDDLDLPTVTGILERAADAGHLCRHDGGFFSFAAS